MSDCDIGLWGVRSLPQSPSARTDGKEPLFPNNMVEPGNNMEEEFAFWTTQECEDSPTKLHYVKCQLGETGQNSSLLIDTGSAVSILPKRTARKHGLVVQSAGRGTRLVGFSGEREEAVGSVDIPVTIGKSTRTLTFFVTENATKPILGLDALKKFRLILDLNNGSLVTPTQERIFCQAVEIPVVHSHPVELSSVGNTSDEAEAPAASSSGSKN